MFGTMRFFPSEVVVNCETIKHREPFKIIEAILQTEIEQDNVLRKTNRKTRVFIHKKQDKARIFLEWGEYVKANGLQDEVKYYHIQPSIIENAVTLHTLPKELSYDQRSGFIAGEVDGFTARQITSNDYFIHAQISRQERNALADDIILNDSNNLNELRKSVEQLHQFYLTKC